METEHQTGEPERATHPRVGGGLMAFFRGAKSGPVAYGEKRSSGRHGKGSLPGVQEGTGVQMFLGRGGPSRDTRRQVPDPAHSSNTGTQTQVAPTVAREARSSLGLDGLSKPAFPREVSYWLN